MSIEKINKLKEKKRLIDTKRIELAAEKKQVDKRKKELLLKFKELGIEPKQIKQALTKLKNKFNQLCEVADSKLQDIEI